jgi:hypothetical protein
MDFYEPLPTIKQDLSDSSTTDDEYTPRKNYYNDPDDWHTLHCDDLWYLWNKIREYTRENGLAILDKMDYARFCVFCYENSSVSVAIRTYGKMYFERNINQFKNKNDT